MNGFLPNEFFKEEQEAIEKLKRGERLEHPEVLLIDPFDYPDDFNKELLNVPGLFKQEGRITIKTKEQFNNSMSDMFKNLDWSNVVIAGGYALSLLIGSYSSDIDFFIYGLSDEDTREKIEQIIFHFESLDEGKYGILGKTERSITISVREIKDEPVQIILRRYDSIAEILLNFDLPCVRVAFDGTTIKMLKSAKNAIANGYNVATGYQPFRTGTYEYRLMKYFRRGFNIRVPNYYPDRIDKEVLDTASSEQVIGLMKLLILLRDKGKPGRHEIIKGDYDPYQSVFLRAGFMLGPANEGDERKILNLKEIIKFEFKSDVKVQIIKENWPEVFSGEETVILNSTVQYLNSLPEPSEWYCQAYRIPVKDCII